MDAYYKFLAHSLCEEALEVFRGMGYDWLADGLDHPGTNALSDFPIGTAKIETGTSAQFERPAEAGLFQRTITLSRPNGSDISVIQIDVSVQPVAESVVSAWLSLDRISMQTLVYDIKP